MLTAKNTNAIQVEEFLPLKDSVVVHQMEFGERLSHAGLILPNDDMKNSGIRPRWARVYAIGPDQKDLQVGQWIYIAHGRWTRGVKIEDTEGVQIVRKVDNKDILLVSDEKVQDYNMSDKGI
jgi:co-chaperonin GroES (HSP10)